MGRNCRTTSLAVFAELRSPNDGNLPVLVDLYICICIRIYIYIPRGNCIVGLTAPSCGQGSMSFGRRLSVESGTTLQKTGSIKGTFCGGLRTTPYYTGSTSRPLSFGNSHTWPGAHRSLLEAVVSKERFWKLVEAALHDVGYVGASQN